MVSWVCQNGTDSHSPSQGFLPLCLSLCLYYSLHPEAIPCPFRIPLRESRPWSFMMQLKCHTHREAFCSSILLIPTLTLEGISPNITSLGALIMFLSLCFANKFICFIFPSSSPSFLETRLFYLIYIGIQHFGFFVILMTPQVSLAKSNKWFCSLVGLAVSRSRC